jgi:hypothetical protein
MLKQIGVMGLAAGLTLGGGLASAIAAGPNSATLWVDGVNSSTARSGDGAVRFGDRVHFGMTQERTSTPWVRVTCTQAGQVVYGHTLGYFDGALGDQWFTMGPTGKWTGGEADCKAELLQMQGTKARVLAETRFITTS